MTRLKYIIEQLCPDGVEYKTLGEIATISRGGSFQKKHFVDSGVPCIHYGQIYTRYGLFAHEALTYISYEVAEKQRFAQPNDIVMAVTSENIEDVCKCVVWLGDTSVAVSGHSAIIHHSQNAKFLAYYFHSSMFFAQKRKIAQGTKVIEVSPEKLNRVTIPIPPLEVQAEIVRILDKFTELTTELTKELANRKKQFEYYRNNLLTFNTNVEMKKLKDVSESIASGKNKNRSESGKYPVYGSTGIIAKTNVPVFSKKQILVARVGANAGYVHIADGEYDVSDNTLIIDIKTGYSIKYIYHYLVNKNLNQFAKGGGQPLITAGQLKELQLPVPNIEVQERIVNVLDSFDAICCDLNIGLPAEIEARQKQYEYYRDKLLSFKKGEDDL